MSSIILSDGKKGPTLNFVPEEYREEVVETVLFEYKSMAISGHMHWSKMKPSFPNVVEIGYSMNDHYLIGCMYQETGNPNAFRNAIDDANTNKERTEIWEHLFSQFNDRGYMGWRDEFLEDVAAVLNFHHLSFVSTWSDPFNPFQVYFEVGNQPIIEVW